MEYYLAIDIGASGGRHILGHLEQGRFVTEEIYRFSNGSLQKDGELVWNVEQLFQEVLTGMTKCKTMGKIPVSVGIDTWAVDFVLLDEEDQRIGNVVSYRDHGVDGMDAEVRRLISEEELYQRTGIQKQPFNTIYQLMAWKRKKPELFQKAKSLLLIPDYLHFLLSGIKATEYTNATTTQLVSPLTKDWDRQLIEQLGYPQELFQNLVLPGTCLGTLTKEVQQKVGFECRVVVPATHDTASAVVAVPAEKNKEVLYISSGTWSLMGTELSAADCSEESRKKNMTNEGGYDYRFRYLKNIMGLWMIQSVKKEIGQKYGFGELCELARQTDITSLVDANAARFLSPKNMTEEIRSFCRETGQQVPETVGEVASVVYRSLAVCYGKTLEEIENVTGQYYDTIYIVGGGSAAEYLNELTTRSTGRTVFAGPMEATAVGNLAVQMLATGKFSDLEQARSGIRISFKVKKYETAAGQNAE